MLLVLTCFVFMLYNIAQNLFKEEERTTKKGKIKKGRIFTLPHCYEVLKDDEKWKKREDLDDLHLSNNASEQLSWMMRRRRMMHQVMTAREAPHPTRFHTRSQNDHNGCKKDNRKEEEERR